MKTITIHVTERWIITGSRQSCCFCPVALAIKEIEALHEEVEMLEKDIADLQTEIGELEDEEFLRRRHQSI